MLNRFLAVALVVLSLIALAGCAAVEVEDEERGHIGVSTY